jgi:hypothetical protein
LSTKKVGEDKSLRIARIGIFAALYAATSLVPISMFIGAPSFLALNLIITPAIAILLSPIEAFWVSLIGAVISLYIAPFQVMFGPFTVLLPVAGSTLGSLSYHKPRTGGIVFVYLVSVVFLYLIARPEFPYWIVPHIAAAIFAGSLSLTNSPAQKIRIPLYAFVSTICEQATMLLCAVYILSLPWVVFATAFPLMLYERFAGTIGGTLIAYSLLRTMPKYFHTFRSTQPS